MKFNNVIRALLTFVLFLTLTSAFSQTPSDPDPDLDNPGDPLNPAPIGDYMLPMLVLGVATAYVLLRKKATTKVL